MIKVTYLDHMGDDVEVVNDARVSFNKESDWKEIDDGSAEWLSEKDQKLIAYLAKHDHWTPSAHVQIKMHEKVPIFVARQRFKHTIGFVYSEVSRRYVDDPPEFYIPESWRKRADNIKQGSSDEIVMTEDTAGFKNYCNDCAAYYSYLIDCGVAPEQARMVLPQAMMTEYRVTGSLAAWARAYNLRSKPNAQQEIQELAKQWDEIISGITELKHSWSALKN